MIQRPTSGAMGVLVSVSMNAHGARTLGSGWRQRSSASAPTTALFASRISG
jgi:hypothetical protein